MTSSARPIARGARRLGPVLAVTAAVILSGCQVMSPVQTQAPYVAGDGFPVNLGPVDVRNLLVVSDNKGGPGTISASVHNPTRDPVKITFAVQGGSSVSTTIPPFTEQSLSLGEGQVRLDAVPVPPGALVTLQVSTAQAGVNVAQVPVLPSYEFYRSLSPSPTGSPPASPTSSSTTSRTPPASPSS